MEADWTGKFVPAKRADVLNTITSMFEKEFKFPAEPHKPLLNMAYGDPISANGYPPPEVAKEAVKEAVDADLYNGYTHSSGNPETRQAIIDRFSTEEAPFAADDVIITAGCSGALYTVFTSLCETGKNVLVPMPTYPL